MFQALYTYQYVKGLFLSKWKHFCGERIWAVAVASFLLDLSEHISEVVIPLNKNLQNSVATYITKKYFWSICRQFWV